MRFLTFSTNDTHLIISGDTFHLRNYLKEHLKAIWNNEKKFWIIPIGLDSASLRNELETKAASAYRAAREAEAAERKKKRDFAKSPEGKKAAEEEKRTFFLNALKMKAKTGAYHWICCESCEVIDWRRQHTSCDVHAEDGNTFRVRGALYTGD